jgi:hypothetical protein
MAAYNSITIRTVPFFYFLFQESLKAMLLNELEVLYHAHVVFGVVTLIKGF